MSGFAFGFGDGHASDGEDEFERPVTRSGAGGAGRPQSSRGAGGFAGFGYSLEGHGQRPPDTASTYADYDGEVSYVTGHAQSLVGSSPAASVVSVSTGGYGGAGRPVTRGMTGRRMSDVHEEEEYGYGYEYDDEEEEEEEEEESEAEDVFAYRPPGTAEQQQAQAQAQANGAPTATTAATPTTVPMQVNPPAPAYYSPTFNYAAAAPFSQTSLLSPTSLSPHSITPAPGIPRPHIPVSLLPVESPPQTNSSISHQELPFTNNANRSGDQLEEYRLRPLTSPVTTTSPNNTNTNPNTHAYTHGVSHSLGPIPIPVSVSLPGTSSATAGASSSIASPSKKHKTSSRNQKHGKHGVPLSPPPIGVGSGTGPPTASSREIRTASSGYTTASFPYSFTKSPKSGSRRLPFRRSTQSRSKVPHTPESGIAWTGRTGGSGSASGSSFDEFDREFGSRSGHGHGVDLEGDTSGDLDGSGSVKMEFDFDQMGIPGEEEEDSPYPEVRASVSNIDDPEMPALTLRMWFVGMMLSILSCSANVFFTFRNPAPTIPPIVVLLIAYPIGKFLAYTLPIRTYKFPSIPIPVWLPVWLGGVRRNSAGSGVAGVQVPGGVTGRVSVPGTADGAMGLGPDGLGGLGGVKGRQSGQRFLGGWEISLNPGPWNIKEHVLIYIMSNVTNVPPYSLNMIVVSDLYYNVRYGFGFDLLLTYVTQLTGFGLAGLCRRFLVWPAAMVWPQNLVVCTLLNTLHAEDDFVPPLIGANMGISVSQSGGTMPSGGRRGRKGRGWFGWWIPRTWWAKFKYKGNALWGGTIMTRYQFFVLVGLASFVWFFLPGYFFTGLSLFSWACWIAPKNVVVNQLFGTVSGLGMGWATFDWTQISAWNGSPLAVPWWAQCHVFIGFVFFYWTVLPILYYTNVWHFAYFPISSGLPYDRNGEIYNVTRVLTPEVTLDLHKYQEYSPLYLPANYAMTYLIAFAMSTCILVHTALHHGRSILNQVKKVKMEADDIHAKLMRNYPEVPDWWYGAVFFFFFLMGIVLVEVWHTKIPVWILILSLLLPIIYILPGGLILAMTGQPVGINILAQIIPGAIVPGSPLVNMLFKTYAIQTLVEAEEFVQDLKLGHYIKVPPRATFIVQLAATTIAATVQIGVKTWLFASVDDICKSNQRSHLTCPHNEVFFTASAVWGLIGPSRQFGKHTLYNPQLYALVVGAILPIPFWFWHRKYPNSRFPVVNIPVLLNGISQIPPATGINFSSWFATGFIFQYLIRKKNFAWWSKYNYVTSSGLDCGTFVAIIIIFFCLAYPNGGVNVNWWGNNVWQQTADAMSIPFRTAPPGGIPGT